MFDKETITKILDALENFGAQIVYDRSPKNSIFLKALKGLLVGLSYIFSAATQLRSWLYYKASILKTRSLGCLVIVVGNLTVGGTGKTPVVEKLARNLQAQGRRVAILSRGYKSKSEKLHRRFWRWLTHQEAPPPKVVSDGTTVLMGPEEAGDEPYMLANSLEGVVVVVDKDRVKSGRYAIERFGVDTLLLDDGFQYLRLKGHINLLLIDKTNPFGNHFLLPRGILREPIKQLNRATYVLITKSDGNPLTSNSLKTRILEKNPQAKIIESTHTPQHLCSINNGEKTLPLSMLKEVPVAIFSGIAAPESFENFLIDLGAKIVFRKHFVDHHPFTTEELFNLFAKALSSGAQFMITTEKDAARIPKAFKAPIPLFYLRLEIDIIGGHALYKELLDRICLQEKTI